MLAYFIKNNVHTFKICYTKMNMEVIKNGFTICR